jgi:cell division protease FtsH
VATQLLERETLTRDDILLLKAGKELPPRLPPDMPMTTSPLAAPAAPVSRPIVPPMLAGPEVAPA